jgi:hypothetical protein
MSHPLKRLTIFKKTFKKIQHFFLENAPNLLLLNLQTLNQKQKICSMEQTIKKEKWAKNWGDIGPSLSDVFPNENSYILRSLDKMVLAYPAPDQTNPFENPNL